MTMVRKCGCKGIRTCLLCEQQNKYSTDGLKTEEAPSVYTYCPRCNLCWPDTASRGDFPLHLGRVTLIPEFLSEEEEASAVASIDGIPWLPSQSGRRKQDFGPKVNFKKKKVRLGEFRGFPKFTESTVQKLKRVPELSDFRPVELCHLEYCPDRGSSIVPHVDDFWLWGERLVTVNLGSSTVLCLTPCSASDCDCLADLQSSRREGGVAPSCRHALQDVPLSGHATSKSGDVHPREVEGAVGNSQWSSPLRSLESSRSGADCLTDSEGLQRPGNNLCPEDRQNSVGEVEEGVENLQWSSPLRRLESSRSGADCSIDSEGSQRPGNNPRPEDRQSSVGRIADAPSNCQTLESSVQKTGSSHHSRSCDCAMCRTRLSDPPVTASVNSRGTMCGVFRSSTSSSKARIRVVLPPRSLLVLAGCARYNWYHEIRRGDVVSRRLAMTFRELAAEFLDGGRESQVGTSLLETANNFYDLQEVSV